MKTDLFVTVEAYAGTDIPDGAIPQMVELASKLGINVHADLNGVQVMAKPNVNARALAEKWRDELMSKRQPKIACAHPGDLPTEKYSEGRS